ncbi:MAG: 30S ribosomal protein S7 [Firmicutes bacterium]|nr:30S ribosomal protein S7 [Bacillota bacterium]
MPRKGSVPKRDILVDPQYESELVARLINAIMLDGKKSTAESIVYSALGEVQEKTGKDPMEVVEEALKNIMPVLEVKPRRVGGATYQVPVEVRPDRRRSLALRWLVQFSRTRGERSMASRLAAELMDAANNTGGAVRRKEETHRMAEANKAFAHYRW